MTIVDFHVHVFAKETDWHPWVHDYLRKANPNFYKDYGKGMTPEDFSAYFKRQGVDYAVVLAEQSPISTGVVTNEYVASLCGNQKNLIPFASINPRTTAEPAAELDRVVTQLGMKGLKLYPSYQHFYPNDSLLYPVYARAADLKIPVMVHTGSSVFKGAKMKYAQPVHLDDVAVDFPDLVLIQSHGGRGFWYDEAFFLAVLHKNVFIDIAGLPPQNLLSYFPNLEKAQDKIVFGSDWPGADVRENIRKIKELPIGERAKEKILGSNARRILRI